MNAKIQRQTTITDARRSLILAAAERLLLRVGMHKASMREIAKEAGYTPGALYSYFSSRQQLMVALLTSVLQRLDVAVAAAMSPKGATDSQLVLRGRAWMEHLLCTPLDRQLLVYFFTEGQEERDGVAGMLRAQVCRTLLPLAELPPLSDLPSHDMDSEIDGILAHAVGLLLLSGVYPTGFGDKDAVLGLERYLQRLDQIYRGSQALDTASDDPHRAQIDLFN